MSEPIPAERPLRRDAERNRQRILAGARTLYAREGLGASLDDVAREAGVGVGTVYRRFPEKEQLIKALFEERIGEVVALAEAARAVPDPWEGLVQFLKANLELQSADRGLKELLLNWSGGRSIVRGARERITPAVQEILTAAQAAGQVRADVTVEDVALVQVLVSGVMDSAGDVAPDLWRRSFALVLDGLRVGEPPPLPGPPPTPEQFEDVMRCWRPPVR